MKTYQAPLADMQFILRDVFAVADFWASFPATAEVDWATATAVLEEAAKICEEAIAPHNREADEIGCKLHNGEVTSPPGFKEAYTTFCQGGWGGLGGNPDYGGMGMPKSLVASVEEMLQGSCMALGLAPMLTAGACLAINTHASDALKARYLPNLYAGTWSGAMDLTEPQAGTDLGLIRTKAEPQTDGSYAITGSKIFITWGEQDFTDNIIHLVLAKLPNAPAGAKGISLFLVPKFLVNDDGSLGARNAVTCGALEKKMGIKASATCVMNFDSAIGWLVGEPHQGLACMFTMMNYERLVVGIQGLGTAHASYVNACAYAQERLQSRSPTGPTHPTQAADPLIAQPDVRRMLLTMRALNEGGRAFYTWVAMALDAAKFSSDPMAQKSAEQKVALLTPVAKAFLTDMAFDATVQGQMVFGGHGYIREWGQEQFVRDVRITQIYEGTNGIQAGDFLGRKIVGSQGKLLEPLGQEIEAFIAAQQSCPAMAEFIESLASSWQEFSSCTANLLAATATNPCEIGANAVDYLHLFGFNCYAFLWARMAAAAIGHEGDFYQQKIQTARFFFQRLLPQTHSLRAKIASGSASIMGPDAGSF